MFRARLDSRAQFASSSFVCGIGLDSFANGERFLLLLLQVLIHLLAVVQVVADDNYGNYGDFGNTRSQAIQ